MAQEFSERLREEAWPIWEQIFRHPFLLELKQGTLPLDKFRYYLIQDYLYLEGFGRAVSLALAKAPDSSTLEKLLRRVTTPIERPLHRKLMPLAGVSPEEMERAVLAPTNLAYTNHLLKVAALGSVTATAAALLPCPWTYHLLGEVLGRLDHPVYGPWSSFYVEGFLEESVNTWRGILDQAGSQGSQGEIKAIREAFLTSSRYEFLFWDMAYKQETWPV